MIAARDLKYSARIWKHALFNILYPSPIHAHRNVILSFARDGAGVASDALAIVDYESVVHR